MPSFSTMRNVELSTIFYIETQINGSWSDIEVTKSFTSVYNKTVPVICVQLTDIGSIRLEVGSTTLYNTYGFDIDIFAKHDGQRIDLAGFILDKLKDGWVYYTHTQTAGVLNRTSAGRIRVNTFIQNSKLTFGDIVENPDRFRHLISFDVRNV